LNYINKKIANAEGFPNPTFILKIKLKFLEVFSSWL